jgi:hypothetical protein
MSARAPSRQRWGRVGVDVRAGGAVMGVGVGVDMSAGVGAGERGCRYRCGCGCRRIISIITLFRPEAKP